MDEDLDALEGTPALDAIRAAQQVSDRQSTCQAAITPAEKRLWAFTF